ncbi:MAG: magnesium-translocating P-type ATPase [Actinomycetes bacterium]|nr:magnesium-translocating P-type ATPase [Actinomycetes bacterium]
MSIMNAPQVRPRTGGWAPRTDAPDSVAAARARLSEGARADIGTLFVAYNSAAYDGHDDQTAEVMRERYGANVFVREARTRWLKSLAEAFVNPFTVVLFVLAVISFFTDYLAPPPGEKSLTAVIIVVTMVTISGLLRFVQEARSGAAAKALGEMVETTSAVVRNSDTVELPIDEVVVGDIIRLAAGDMVPADLRLLDAKDLFVSQSALTGEAEPLEKYAQLTRGRGDGEGVGAGAAGLGVGGVAAVAGAAGAAGAVAATTGTAAGTTAPDATEISPLELDDLTFMGSNVVSGFATGIVLATGASTYFGQVAHAISGKQPPTSFERGAHAVSWVLIRFMLAMVPVVLVLTGITKHDWMGAVLFALAVAVGMTPEMLPMIVSVNLAKGAVAMSRGQVIVKDLNSIQNFGGMDVLCTDKTGTLTQDRIVLEYSLDVHGNEDNRVLRHAFLNSYYQTGLRNLLDEAIIDHADDLDMSHLTQDYTKVDEIPFDFNRRRMSVVVSDLSGKRQMITKGAIEEMLTVCRYVEYDGLVLPLTEDLNAEVLATVRRYNLDGMRVLGIAQKTNLSPDSADAFSVDDETAMVLIGYLAFLDPPKESTRGAVDALHHYGIDIKVLTGDNDAVARAVCRQVDIQVTNLLLGTEIEQLTDEELDARVEDTDIFAKLSPTQKVRIIAALRRGGHTVGYLGDGINDAAAMKESDVGISVDTAVDIAKESANIILLEKDLMVLERGIIEGRKVYGNTIKYIKMTASSNFGNMLSVLFASAFLPFLPLLPLQILVLNLIYDISCTTMPWDNVDDEFLRTARRWDAGSIVRFMLCLGPTSSLFDIATFLVMLLAIGPAVFGAPYGQLSPSAQAGFAALFHGAWFIESLWTQMLVLHNLRSPKLPLVGSHASWQVTTLTLAGIAVGTAIPFTPLGRVLGFVAPPGLFFGWLAFVCLAYMVLVTIAKRAYVRRFGELL